MMIETLVVLLLVVLVDVRWHLLHDHIVVGMRGSLSNVLLMLEMVVKCRMSIILLVDPN